MTDAGRFGEAAGYTDEQTATQITLPEENSRQRNNLFGRRRAATTARDTTMSNGRSTCRP
jgi:hypothetical protein